MSNLHSSLTQKSVPDEIRDTAQQLHVKFNQILETCQLKIGLAEKLEPSQRAIELNKLMEQTNMELSDILVKLEELASKLEVNERVLLKEEQVLDKINKKIDTI